MEPVFFERPTGPTITLRAAPRLANWNRAGDSGEARLTRALSYSDEAVDPRLAACDGPVALRFDVGLARAVRLLDERDLDNYLLPLTAYLAERSPHPIVSVWGCKRYAEETTLRIEPARPRPEQEPEVTLRATVTGAREAFKAGLREQVHEQLTGRPALPEGPVVLELAFVVGPQRSWLDLWWSTLDGLGPLLGHAPSEPQWHPRDGRVVDLGLHVEVDPELGDDVLIGLRAASGWLDPQP